jgi:hypothetical protein
MTTFLYCVLVFLVFSIGTILLLAFVAGGRGLGGEDEDARDDYISYKELYEDNITSGSAVVNKE